MDDPLIRRLDSTGVADEIVESDPDLADTAEFCEADGYSPGDSANTVAGDRQVLAKEIPA